MLKVAVATSNGKDIDEHFGQAKVFHIFQVEEDGAFSLLSKREITPHCPGDHEVAHSADATVAQLDDVEAVFAHQIGPGAVRNLEGKGIRAFALSGSLERALSSYGKRHKLIESGVLGLPSASAGGKTCGCSGGCKK